MSLWLGNIDDFLLTQVDLFHRLGVAASQLLMKEFAFKLLPFTNRVSIAPASDNQKARQGLGRFLGMQCSNFEWFALEQNRPVKF